MILYYLFISQTKKELLYHLKMPRSVGKSLGRGKKRATRSDNAILFQGKKNNLSHREIMNKRHQKKKKKTRKTNEERKKELLNEYNGINDVSFTSKKTTARNIMNLVEDIKEEGLNDGNYLSIMNELMALNKEEENEKESDYIRDNYNTYTIRNINDEIYRSYQPPSHFADHAAPLIISPSGMSAVAQEGGGSRRVPPAWAREGGRSGMDTDHPSHPFYRY